MMQTRKSVNRYCLLGTATNTTRGKFGGHRGVVVPSRPPRARPTNSMEISHTGQCNFTANAVGRSGFRECRPRKQIFKFSRISRVGDASRVPSARSRARPSTSPRPTPGPRSSRLARTTRRRGERSPSTRPNGSRRSSHQPCTSSRASPRARPAEQRTAGRVPCSRRSSTSTSSSRTRCSRRSWRAQMLTDMPRWARRHPPRLSCGSKMATSLGESHEGPLVGGDQEVPWGAVRPRRGEEHAHVYQRHVV